MKKRLPALVLALILLTGLAAVCAQASGLTGDTVMYVYTDNGKGLNVRSAPYVGNNIIGLAKYGSRLTIVRFLDSGWACINCSPVDRIILRNYSAPHRQLVKSGMTAGQIKIRDCCTDYIRMEVVDAQGRRAWTNPIFLGETE